MGSLCITYTGLSVLFSILSNFFFPLWSPTFISFLSSFFIKIFTISSRWIDDRISIIIRAVLKSGMLFTLHVLILSCKSIQDIFTPSRYSGHIYHLPRNSGYTYLTSVDQYGFLRYLYFVLDTRMTSVCFFFFFF